MGGVDFGDPVLPSVAASVSPQHQEGGCLSSPFFRVQGSQAPLPLRPQGQGAGLEQGWSWDFMTLVPGDRGDPDYSGSSGP